MLASPGCTTKTPDSDGTLGGAAWPGISSRTVVRRPARYFLGRRRSDTHSVSGGRISGRSALPTTHVTSPYSPRSGPRSCPAHAGRGRVLLSGGRPSFDHLPGNGARLRYRRRVGVLEQSRGTGARPVRAAWLSSHRTHELHSSAISGPRQPGGATRTTRAMRRECSRRVAPRHRNLTHRACGTGATPSSSESSCPAPGARRAASSARHPMVRKQRPVLVNRNCSRLALPR